MDSRILDNFTEALEKAEQTASVFKHNDGLAKLKDNIISYDFLSKNLQDSLIYFSTDDNYAIYEYVKNSTWKYCKETPNKNKIYRVHKNSFIFK